MKIYIAGKITDFPAYKKVFDEAEERLKEKGHAVMNPSVLPDGFEHGDYMKICFSMIDVCDAAYFLFNWRDSVGARMEHDYAHNEGKVIFYQEGLA